MLYTGNGDDGKTKTFGCDQRISKSSAVAEALGTLDEINSFLGMVKVECVRLEGNNFLDEKSLSQIVHGVQENLFIVQAEIAGSPMNIAGEKVSEAETMINEIEAQLPPIKTFFISGGTELGALFDFSRTLARCAERRVVSVKEEGLYGVMITGLLIVVLLLLEVVVVIVVEQLPGVVHELLLSVVLPLFAEV